MAIRSKITKNGAKQWIGQPVYIELIDGRSYVGWVTDAKSEQLVISGQRTPRKTKKTAAKRAGKATVSGLFPGVLGSLAGGGGSMLGGGKIPGFGGIGGGGIAGGIAGGLGGLGNFNKIGAFGGLGGIMGFIGNAFPVIKMGYGMIKSIMPMLKMFNV